MTDTEVVARKPDRPRAGKAPLVDAATDDYAPRSPSSRCTCDQDRRRA